MTCLVVTMAGLGTRFTRAGYACPKYMVEACGRTLFSWSMESVRGLVGAFSRCVFVARSGLDARGFVAAEMEALGYGGVSFEVLELDAPTDGQATTALAALEGCDPGEGLLVWNIDTYVEPWALGPDVLAGDGCIPCFRAEGDHWSFVAVDGSGRAVDVAEKCRISNNCSVGAYWFASAALYERAYIDTFGSGTALVNGERYIAPMYAEMIERGMDVRMALLDASAVHVLGTPAELEAFERQYSEGLG